MEKTKKILAVLLALILVTICFPTVSSADGEYTLSGSAHVQKLGDKEGTFDGQTLTLGTRGQSLRLEEVTINFENNTGYTGDIQYRVHVQNKGWTDWVNTGTAAGSRGECLRLEGIEMRVTGELANHYQVVYCAHIQTYGDAQGWVSGVTLAGTTGESKRLEEIRVKLMPLDSSASVGVSYHVHVQNNGWENTWKADGATSGTTGESKRLEGITINLTGSQYTGAISYKTHVQDIGWQDWVSNGEMSGTQGQSKRLEAIAIKLSGDVSNYYDVYYRVHAQNFGWMAWAKNGAYAGTSGYSYRLEAIQIVLMPKGRTPTATSSVSYAYKDGTKLSFTDFAKKYKTSDNMVGIDVSSWQGEVDFEKVAADGAEFVMIRALKYTGSEYYVDKYFKQNIKNAKAAGLKVGVYYNTKAADEATIRQHAKDLAELLDSTGITLDFPVAYDWESFSDMSELGVTYSDLNNLWYAFADEMEDNGYDTMLYSSKYYLNKFWDEQDHDVWLAHYTESTNYKGPYVMWQKGSNGRINGIDADVDLDVYYPNGVNQ